MSKSAVELQGVRVVYGADTSHATVALEDVSFSIPPGALVVITGGNGSGKSTLLKAIAGAVKPTSGRVWLEGIDVTDQPMHVRATRVGVVNQDPLLGTCPNLTVHENLELASARKWWSLAPMRLRAGEGTGKLFDQLHLALGQRLGAFVSSLSGGQRQALALVLCLAGRPRLLLLDEFTAALESRVQIAAIDLIATSVKGGGSAALVVSHDPSSLLPLAQGQIHLEDGRIAHVEGMVMHTSPVC